MPSVWAHITLNIEHLYPVPCVRISDILFYYLTLQLDREDMVGLTNTNMEYLKLWNTISRFAKLFILSYIILNPNLCHKVQNAERQKSIKEKPIYLSRPALPPPEEYSELKATEINPLTGSQCNAAQTAWAWSLQRGSWILERGAWSLKLE